MLKNNKGITLVELLIVIVILGIIAAIAVPAVGNIVENARVDAFISEGRTISSAANVACTTEDYRGCDTWRDDYDFDENVYNDDYDGDAWWFITEDQLVEDGYLEGFDGQFFAWRYEGTWYVAWEEDGYFAAGNPNDIERADVFSTEDYDLGNFRDEYVDGDNGDPIPLDDLVANPHGREE